MHPIVTLLCARILLITKLFLYPNEFNNELKGGSSFINSKSFCNNVPIKFLAVSHLNSQVQCFNTPSLGTQSAPSKKPFMALCYFNCQLPHTEIFHLKLTGKCCDFVLSFLIYFKRWRSWSESLVIRFRMKLHNSLLLFYL